MSEDTVNSKMMGVGHVSSFSQESHILMKSRTIKEKI